MQENEFEKQVQQKMDELRLRPSDAVWLKIEVKIPKEKRRRWILIFWPVVLIGFLYGGYIFLNKNFNPQLPQQETKKLTQNNNSTKETKANSNSIKNNDSLISNKQTIAKVELTRSPQKQKIKVQGKLKIKSNYGITSLKNTPSAKPISDTTASIVEDEKLNTAIKTPQQEILVDKPGNIFTNENESAKSGEVNFQKDANEIKKKTIPNEENKINGNKKVVANKKSWNFGFSFSAGISGAANNLFENLFGDVQKSASLQNNPAASGSYTLGVVPTPSFIRSSLAFITGIFAEKNISEKTIFTTGLNYKLFSTTNRVGTDSATFLRAYNNVNTYHNFYHFIEIPISLKFQIADLKKIKLYWNTGFSISQLISAKALQFNYSRGLYYRDNSLFNKTQTGFNTGLDIGFSSKQKTSFLIGPYLNYGITKIANEGYNKHHFTFIGLKAQYLFRKK